MLNFNCIYTSHGATKTSAVTRHQYSHNKQTNKQTYSIP